MDTSRNPTIGRVHLREASLAGRHLRENALLCKRLEFDGLVERIDQAEEGLRTVEETFADPPTCRSRRDELRRLRVEPDQGQANVAEFTSCWEELEERTAVFEAAAVRHGARSRGARVSTSSCPLS